MSLPATQNIVMPAMEFYFDAFDAQGLPTGERWFGDTSAFEVTIEPTIVEDYSGTGAVAELQLYTSVRTKRTATLTIKNMSAENLALFFGASVAAVSTTAGAVTGDPINGGQALVGGLWYQLGKAAHGNSGVRAIADLDILDGVTPLVEGTDYIEDLALGRIYVVEGGAADGTVCTADYSTTVAAWDRLSSTDLALARGILRGKSNNTAGAERDLVGNNVSLIPTGNLAFSSRDNVQSLQLQVAFLKPSGSSTPALVIDGRPV